MLEYFVETVIYAGQYRSKDYGECDDGVRKADAFAASWPGNLLKLLYAAAYKAKT
jgi:hypothetical protein